MSIRDSERLDTIRLVWHKLFYNDLMGCNIGGFSGQFIFVLVKSIFMTVVVLSDLVYDVETIHGLC